MAVGTQCHRRVDRRHQSGQQSTGPRSAEEGHSGRGVDGVGFRRPARSHLCLALHFNSVSSHHSSKPACRFPLTGPLCRNCAGESVGRVASTSLHIRAVASTPGGDAGPFSLAHHWAVPVAGCLPRDPGVAAFASVVSRPALRSLALRAAHSLSRPKEVPFHRSASVHSVTSTNRFDRHRLERTSCREGLPRLGCSALARRTSSPCPYRRRQFSESRQERRGVRAFDLTDSMQVRHSRSDQVGRMKSRMYSKVTVMVM